MLPAPRQFTLSLLPERFALSRFAPDAPLPSWAHEGSFFSVTRTRDELSIISDEQNVPEHVPARKGWRSLKVRGLFDVSEIGVLSALAAPLARAGISLFAVSTFDTDYLFVEGGQLDAAIIALECAGHTIQNRK